MNIRVIIGVPAWGDTCEQPQLSRSHKVNFMYMQPRTITFSRNLFLPLTTACRNRCGYCSFQDTGTGRVCHGCRTKWRRP